MTSRVTLTLASWLVTVSTSGSVLAAEGAVATVHPLATRAGMDVLDRGGNALDAAVAAALMLGVVDSDNSGIGGGCFIVVRTADGRLAAIDGRETAPAAAARDMYLRDGKPQPELSTYGPLAVGTPGAVAAYDRAVREFGRLSLAELLRPAAEVAEHGFRVDAAQAARFKRMALTLRRFEGTRKAFFKPDGSPYQEGDVLKQPDLARAYRAIADRGIGWFYRGPFAERVGRWMAANGGILTADDFAAYRARRRKPVVSTYRGYTIVGFPPPSSGGVHAAQILNILERFDLKSLYENDRVQFYHVIAEAMKLAFADRAYWLGDPDFANVPSGLVDREYAAGLAKRIEPGTAIRVKSHGQPPRWQEATFGDKHTTHIAAADSDGNWVAITATINTDFGSQVVVPGTGVVLNNEMDDFAIAPGVPNAFGLVGAEANAVAPGKRPLSSMSPTVVLRDGKPVFTVGAAGGPTIISQVVLAIVYRIDVGMDLPEALAAPRIHHQWLPDVLRVEKSLDAKIVAGLEKIGHRIEKKPAIGVAQAVGRGADGHWISVREPRLRTGSK